MIKKTINKSFGSFIREIRIENKIGQRELALKIGVAPSYLNDIEKNKRAAPKLHIIKKISSIRSSGEVMRSNVGWRAHMRQWRMILWTQTLAMPPPPAPIPVTQK